MFDSISFIGAGNVSTHFAKAFYQAGLTIDSILSRRLRTSKALAKQVNANATTSYKKLTTDSSLYCIAVPDDSIGTVVDSLSTVLAKESFVVHTSGATPVELVLRHFPNHGFMWPPQSLSKQKDIPFKTVPICYGANTKSNSIQLRSLLKTVSNHIQELDETQKFALHLAAVFANNFSNHMYTMAHEICAQHDLDFSMLYPIILETSQKIIGTDPHKMQTGPAIRGDESSIKRHLKLLASNPEYKKLYRLLSNNIQSHKSDS